MAKTYKNLFPKIADMVNLLNAFRDASEEKRFQGIILNFEKTLAKNILNLQKELINKSYKHGKYHFFRLFDPKEREISAAPFRDRIVHHAVCQIIEPIFDKKFIYDSYACRQNKGGHKAVKRLQNFLRKIYQANRLMSVEEVSVEVRLQQNRLQQKKLYALKCDISKCFSSINHEILIKLLERKINDKDTMWLLREIINSYETSNQYDYLFPPDSYFRIKRPRGIPIGNLTSQLFVNVYLNELDQYIKHHLRIKYYVRYVDDFVILSENKQYLRQLVKKIGDFLYNELYLTLHPIKLRIFPVHLGIDFLGYVIFKDHIRLRSQNVKAFRKKLKRFQKLYQANKISKQKIKESITSWIAHAEHADTYRLRKAIFGKPLIAKNQEEIEKFIDSWMPPAHHSEKPTRKSSDQLRLF